MCDLSTAEAKNLGLQMPEVVEGILHFTTC